MFIQPNRRAANVHVEYETDAWISVFNVTLSLSRVVRVLGGAYASASKTLGNIARPDGGVAHKGTKEIVEALEVVLTCLVGICRTNGGDLPFPKDAPLLLSALHARMGQRMCPNSPTPSPPLTLLQPTAPTSTSIPC